MTKFKSKFAAVALALAVACGIGWGASPAFASPGNHLINHSIGAIHVEYNNGTRGFLYGWGSNAYSVDYIVVDVGSCVTVGTTPHCAPYSTYKVFLGYGQFVALRTK